MSLPIVIPQGIDASTSGQHFAREAMAFSSEPHLQVRTTAGAEASNVRRFTLQVVNRRGKACFGPFALLVIIGTVDGGAPGGTQTVSVVTGAMLQTITANQALIINTAANGSASIDITVSGAGTRYVQAGVMAAMYGTPGVVWT